MFGKRSNTTAAAEVLEEPVEQLWAPTASTAAKSVETLLLERGQINEDHLLQARTVQRQTPGKTIAQILLSMSAASEQEILAAQAQTLGLTFEALDRSTIDAKTYALLPVDY